MRHEERPETRPSAAGFRDEQLVHVCLRHLDYFACRCLTASVVALLVAPALRARLRRTAPVRVYDYLLVESTGLSEPLPAAEPRLGRRTVLTFPLLPPPQKN